MADGEEPKSGFEQGKVHSHGDPLWEDFPPAAGCVLEFEGPGLVWCALLCTELRNLPTGDVLCVGRFLGAGTDHARKLYGGLINRKNQPVHFCRHNPCDLGDEAVLGGVAAHSLRGRYWRPAEFPGEYLQQWGGTVLKEYIAKGVVKTRRKPPEVPGPASGEREERKGRRKREPVLPDLLEEPWSKEPRKKKPRKEKGGPGEDKDLGRVAILREKLKALRGQMDGAGTANQAEIIDVGSSDGGLSDLGDSDYAVVPKSLNTGDQMNPRLSHLGVGQVAVKSEDTKGGIMKKRKRSLRKKKAMAEKVKTSSQLLAMAEQREACRKEDSKKKKGRRSGSSKAKAVVKLLKGRKKTRKGSDPSDDGSSSEEGSTSEESSSESEPLAPLLKRSRKSPGKVLKLLVDHAQEALDQSALVETADGSAVTGGVKMATYFNLLIRPYHPTTSRDMKELHHLAICLDELRSGRLGSLGDSLASRFLAIHSAVNEGGWKAAQFLELHPLEPTQSAPTSLLLQARKHAHVVAKSHGGENVSRWQRPGGGSWQRQDYSEKGKGKGGKGKDSKGKGSKGQSSNWWQGGWSDRQNWWDKEKDKKGKDGEEKKKPEK